MPTSSQGPNGTLQATQICSAGRGVAWATSSHADSTKNINRRPVGAIAISNEPHHDATIEKNHPAQLPGL
ncbi:hypothetical protein N7501_000960 [Penicillium viridicatum]|nr:hypothetical protein N7501_000960 [Penicillium viridicatum]